MVRDSVDFQFLVRVLCEAGNLVDSIYRTDFSTREKSAGDPVTEADLRVNDLLRDAVQKEFPGDCFLSEEEIHDLPQNRDRVWILDPIDGTREFVAKNGEFAISFGLWDRGKITTAGIVNPDRGDFIAGTHESGVLYYGKKAPYTLDEVRNGLSPAEKSMGKSNRLLVSRSETRDKLFEQFPLEEDWEMQVMGSIAYKLGLLAIGEIDLIVSLRPKHEWDVAAGIGLVQMAGGDVLDIMTGESYSLQADRADRVGLIAGDAEQIRDIYTKNGNWFRKKYKQFNESKA